MKKSEYISRSLLNALSVFIYTSVVAWILFNGEKIFGKIEPSFLIPLSLLILFIISASITGFLVLGKPILLYLNGLKKESLVLLFSTLAWLALFLILVVVIFAL